MRLRIVLTLLALTLAASGSAPAQVRVHTETIKRPSAPTPSNQFVPPATSDGEDTGATSPPAATDAQHAAAASENTGRLPEAVGRMRERILKAAHSGDPQQVLALMQANGTMPVFSHTQKLDPTAIWKEAYPDSGGVEALSILITILETGFVHVGAGTPQEIYLWPYFAREPLKSLTPEQKVDLFRIVTGADYQDMLERGHYAFYRVGIGPDGAWRYFVSGD
jgi:hypothetical protein